MRLGVGSVPRGLGRYLRAFLGYTAAPAMEMLPGRTERWWPDALQMCTIFPQRAMTARVSVSAWIRGYINRRIQHS